jgi:hypothetical protein
MTWSGAETSRSPSLRPHRRTNRRLDGYSVGELVTQRRRDKTQREKSLTTVLAGNMEIPYERMSQVELTGAKVKIFSGTDPLAIFIPKTYPPMIAARLRELIPSRCWISRTIVSV